MSRKSFLNRNTSKTALACLVFASVLVVPAFAKDKIKVVTSFTVLADMAQNVAGEEAEVVSITKPGAGIHNYQPTPQDLVAASGADLILWNGLNLEIWFEQFLQMLGTADAVVLSDGIDPIAIGEGPYTGKANPHAWMGLENAYIYIDNIRDALIEIDHENKDIYEANAMSYKTAIRETIEPIRDALKTLPDARRWLVSCEGAFSYLTRDYGLQELYLWPMNTDQVGTPQQVRKVIDEVKANEIPAVFCESTVNPAPAEQIARETGAKFGGLLYVDSLSAEDGPTPTYLDLLRVTSETILDGLSE